ncbi:MAG TPA: hypothetical protein VFT82_03425 [Candidatus Paceibacterota bacterium]|nr:hypothetical protein [Candidatus Paceibacterota bacterium]
MKTDVVPELESKIKSAAEKLAQSSEDSLAIEGGDNKVLVKAQSNLAKQMIAENRLLFPYSHGGEEYVVCISEVR